MPGPAIILVKPQLGENIGKSARAMLNFGHEDLRLVAPRDGWPNDTAYPAAAGAGRVLDGARVFETTAAAIKDLTFVLAATARNRDMDKPVFDLRTAAKQLKNKEKTGILFGREAAGLSNADVVLADAILTVPVNPGFNSLNLAVAVGVIAYECYMAGGDKAGGLKTQSENRATKGELTGLFAHLEAELDKKGYFRPKERKAAMVASLRNLLQSGGFSGQQVATLRGVIKALSRDTKS